MLPSERGSFSQMPATKAMTALDSFSKGCLWIKSMTASLRVPHEEKRHRQYLCSQGPHEMPMKTHVTSQRHPDRWKDRA